MSDMIASSLITVLGMLGAAWIGGRLVLGQARQQAGYRIRERHLDRLVEALSDVFTFTDPEIYFRTNDPAELTRRINRTELLLSSTDPHEVKLAALIGELGVTLIGMQAGSDDYGLILRLQSVAMAQAKIVIQRNPELPPK